MTFKRVNDFATTDPQRLDRELSQMEDNIAAEFDLAGKTYAKQVSVATFMPVGANSIVALQPSEQRSFDTSQGNALAVLPEITPDLFGKRFTLIKRIALNTVSVSCSDPSATVNGAAFPLAVTAVGVRVFYCDAAGYWS